MNKKEFHYLSFFLWIPFFPLWFIGMVGELAFSLELATLFLSIHLYHLIFVFRIRNWKKTQGNYYDLRIYKFLVAYGSGMLATKMYRPSFEYSYEVNGITYQNNKLGILKKDHEIGSEEEARKVVKVDKKKHTLTVYYNPKNPQESMLLPFFSLRKRLQLYTLLFFASTLTIKEFFKICCPEPFYVYLIELLK